MQKITIDDVARHAGVSVTTVSRVLNDRGYISEAMRSKVQQSINELGFIPNEMARSFYTARTRLVGLIIPTTANPFFGELTYYVEKYLSRRGYKLLICNSIHEQENEKEYLRMLQENRVDGIIVGSHNINIEEYDKMPLKMVSVERAINAGTPVIQCDNYDGGRQAAEALLAAGCRRILCISGDPKLSMPANDRCAAYKDTLSANGLPVEVKTIPFTEENERKRARIEEIFAGPPRYDGVFASDDMLAAMVYNYAVQQGIRVPQQLRIVGFDGTEAMRTALPLLATVKQPIRQLAEQSVEILLKAIEGYPVEQRTVLPVRLVHGLSLGQPAGAGGLDGTAKEAEQDATI